MYEKKDKERQAKGEEERERGRTGSRWIPS